MLLGCQTPPITVCMPTSCSHVFTLTHIPALQLEPPPAQHGALKCGSIPVSRKVFLKL